MEPTNRAWLQLVDALSESERQALLSGDPYETPASEHQLLTLFPNDRLDGAGTIRIHRRISWMPFPRRVLETEYSGVDGTVLAGGTLAFPTGLVGLVIGGSIRDWQESGQYYSSWRTVSGCATRIHLSPGISDARVAELVAGICEQEAELGTLLGLDPPEPSDVFIYSGYERGWMGLPPWDFALPRFRQVHQGEDSTRGHELAHVLLYDAWGQAGSQFAGEGIATLWNGDYDALERARGHLPRDVRISRLSQRFRYDTFGYYGGAAFASFVLSEYGMEAVKTMYQSPNAVDAVCGLSGLSSSEVDVRFADWLWRDPETAR